MGCALAPGPGTPREGGGGVLVEGTTLKMGVLSAGLTTAASAILKIFEELFRLFFLRAPWELFCLFCYVIFYSRIALPLPKIRKTNTLVVLLVPPLTKSILPSISGTETAQGNTLSHTKPNLTATFCSIFKYCKLICEQYLVPQT